MSCSLLSFQAFHGGLIRFRKWSACGQGFEWRCRQAEQSLSRLIVNNLLKSHRIEGENWEKGFGTVDVCQPEGSRTLFQ